MAFKISTHSSHSDNFYFHLSDWVEISWAFTKFFFKQMLKVSAFFLEIFSWKKVLFLKIAVFTDPIFSEGFEEKTDEIGFKF